MNLYWLYDLPNWLFFVLTTSLFISFSLLGAFLFSSKFERKLNLNTEHNSIVSIFLGLSGVFYGITLGLIAVGTFENFNSTEDKVNNESSSLSALYRDVSFFEKNEKETLKVILKEYTKTVINQDWVLQKQGKIPNESTKVMDKFQEAFSNYIPETKKDEIIYSKSLAQYNEFIEKRTLRLNAITASLPSTIWLVLFLGALVNIVLTWLLVIKNRKLDILINILSGLLLGSLIFLIAAMDNPFRGEYCVSADSFQLLLDGLMKK
jgi:Protein of unknown function (DUF4239)